MQEEVEELGQDEMLTGAELLLRMEQHNSEQLKHVTERLASYSKLHADVLSFPSQCRREVLAPVAGGLAYFEAEITSTNNFLVLLGDGWFAERSATQAAEIADRRVAFLRREMKVLSEEREMLQARRTMFSSEVEAKMAPSCGITPSSKVGSSAAEPSMEELATFDELDELTEAELLEIEAELGEDGMEDDELIERLMTERMIAKKEKRMQVEMQRRQVPQPSPAPTTTPTPATTKLYASPADIGRGAVAMTEASPQPSHPTTTTTTTTPSPSQPGEAKKVRFDPSIVAEEEAKTKTAMAAPPAAPSPTSATIVLGDIVEHRTATHTPATELPSMAPTKRKKSRFLQELEGDE